MRRGNTGMSFEELAKNIYDRVITLINSQGQAIDSAIKSISFNGTVVPPSAAGRVTLEETDPNVHEWAKAANKPTYTASEVGALPSSTVIPTKTSDLTNNGDGTSRFATLADLPEGGDYVYLNDLQIHNTAELQQALLDTDMVNGEVRLLIAGGRATYMILKEASEMYGRGMIGLISVSDPPGGNRGYYFLGLLTAAAGEPYMLAFGFFSFSLDAMPTVLGSPCKLVGTPIT